MYIFYHPNVNAYSVEKYEDWCDEVLGDRPLSPSFCMWIVPGTVDPRDD